MADSADPNRTAPPTKAARLRHQAEGLSLAMSIKASKPNSVVTGAATANVEPLAPESGRARHKEPFSMSAPDSLFVDRPTVTKLPVPTSALDKISQAMPGMRELARFAGGPRYEAYFKGGKAAQITKAGNLSPVQHDGTSITEVNKLRSLRPGQLANLGFSFLTVAVGMEHMARIDRQLSRLNEKTDEIAAMLVDDLAAPVRDVAASMHRFGHSGLDGISQETAEAWMRDLRRVRHRIIAKIERLPSGIKPSSSFFWSSQVSDLKSGASKMGEAGWLIQLLAVTDAFLHQIAASTDLSVALDGVDDTVAIRLADEVQFAANALMSSTDKDCGYDSTGKRQLERQDALGRTQDTFREMSKGIKEARNIRILSARLGDNEREFCVTIENDRIVGLSEVRRDQ